MGIGFTLNGETADCFSDEGFIYLQSFRVTQISDVAKLMVEYEESSLLPTFSTQGQDCGPIAHTCPGEQRRMRLVRELGESEWDNG